MEEGDDDPGEDELDGEDGVDLPDELVAYISILKAGRLNKAVFGGREVGRLRVHARRRNIGPIFGRICRFFVRRRRVAVIRRHSKMTLAILEITSFASYSYIGCVKCVIRHQIYALERLKVTNIVIGWIALIGYQFPNLIGEKFSDSIVMIL